MRRADAGVLLLLAALWGGSFLFMRVAVPQFGPFALMALRTGIGALVLIPLVVRSGGVVELRAHAGAIAWVGLLSSALPFVLYGYAMLQLSAGFASILNATVPFWGALVAYAWAGERLGRYRVLGLAIGFAGVLVLVWGRLGFGGEGLGWPILAVLFATMSYGIASVATRKYLGSVSASTNAGGSLLFAALMLLPLAVLDWPREQPDSRAWLAALLLGVLCTGFAYVLFFRLIARIGSTGAIAVTFLVPAFAMFWGVLLLDETVTMRMLMGTATIFAGTALTTGLVDPRGWRGGGELTRVKSARAGGGQDMPMTPETASDASLSLRELLARTLSARREASLRYRQLSADPIVREAPALARTFSHLAVIEAERAARIERDLPDLDVGTILAERVTWTEPMHQPLLESPATLADALDIARRTERGMRAIFEHVAATSPNESVRMRALELALAETRHLSSIEKLVAPALGTQRSGERP